VSTQHPITPTPELVQQWKRTAPHPINEREHYHYISFCAAQWGADQELDAVEEEIITQGWFANSVHRRAQLRAARRPKPPSLKEQALESLERVQDLYPHLGNTKTIRRALEALND
jgi:hypothetical protein